MKLEMKHLAPYLPYELTCVDGGGNIFYAAHFTPNGQHRLVNIGELLFNKSYIIKEPKYRLILRPLSDLKKSGVDFGEYYNENITELNKEAIYGTCEYNVMQKLLENHFDVFGLIPNGLAVDVNDIEPDWESLRGKNLDNKLKKW